jgi:hypothetical protein
MPKTYEEAPSHVATRANKLIERNHSDLWKVEARIDYIFAHNDTGDAVAHRGYPALAVVRIVNLKDRTKGMGDAEITIDAAKYLMMTEAQQDALLDHELHHLIVMRDDEGLAKTDDIGRPRFRMRKHDWDFGWFNVIAERHGLNSPEVTQAKLIWDHSHQALFPFLEDCRNKTIEAETVPPKDGKTTIVIDEKFKGNVEKVIADRKKGKK